jgi:hypothetical protein
LPSADRRLRNTDRADLILAAACAVLTPHRPQFQQVPVVSGAQLTAHVIQTMAPRGRPVVMSVSSADIALAAAATIVLLSKYPRINTYPQRDAVKSSVSSPLGFRMWLTCSR